MFLTPLSAEQHRKLSNPADAAFVKLQAGDGERHDLWVLWFRARIALNLAKKNFAPEVGDALEEVTSRLGELYVYHRRLLSPEPVVIDAEFLASIHQMVETATEIQHETNRMQQSTVYNTEFAHCERVAKEEEAATNERRKALEAAEKNAPRAE